MKMALRTALIYGHSQAQPTGMGDDLLAALAGKNVVVKRVGLQGRGDADLLAEAPGALGDVSDYDRVFLFAGGNSMVQTAADLRKLVEYFGPKRTVVILSPVNLDRDASTVASLQSRNEGNRKGIEDLVPVYSVQAHKDSFKADGIHMRAGSPESVALAKQVIEDLSSSKSMSLLVVGGLVLAAALLALSRRK